MSKKGLGKSAAYTKQILSKQKEQYQGRAVDRITKPGFKRLARRAGCKRLKSDIYDACRERMQAKSKQIVGDSMTFMQHSGRRTISASDVNPALKNNGMKLYGGEY